MAHCYSVGVDIEGKEHTVCTSHVPGNEHVRRALEKGQSYNLTKEDVKRAVDYYRKSKHMIKGPHVEAPQVESMTDPDDDEKGFQQWYAGWAKKAGIHPDPDHPAQQYDYRAAYRKGIEPTIDPKDQKYHWPSIGKGERHPNRYVNMLDTKTGKQIAPQLSDLLREERPVGE
jgi:hypothetical protein